MQRERPGIEEQQRRAEVADAALARYWTTFDTSMLVLSLLTLVGLIAFVAYIAYLSVSPTLLPTPYS